MQVLHRVQIGDFLVIAEAVTGIDAKVLQRSIRMNEAMAALAAPFAGFGDFEVFPEFHQKAGVYCSRINRYHPLIDGNKRTGLLVMREFIGRNGREWVAAGDMSAAEAIEDLAAGLISEDDFLAWVQLNIK